MNQNSINTSTNISNIIYATDNSLITCTTVMSGSALPTNTDGDEIISVTITPISASSILVIEFEGQVRPSATTTEPSLALFQDATVNAINGFFDRRGRIVHIRHIMVSGTTSATTFKVRAGPNGGAGIYFNGDSAGNRLMGGTSSIVLSVKEFI